MASQHSPLLFARQSQGSSSSSSNNSPSISQLLWTLVPVLIVAAIEVGLFLWLRPKLKRSYAPRSYLGSLRQQERSPDLPTSLFGWVGAFNKLPDTYVLTHHSLDGYLLLRYLKMSTIMCLVGCFITWPVLFPVNATGGGGQKQLNILSFSNVIDHNRFYAHTFIAWIYFGFIFFLITRESIYYIHLRQAYLLSPLYAHRMSSRTVLFTSVPADYQDVAKLSEMFGTGVRNVWLAPESEEIAKLVEERDKASIKLEGAETKLIKMANQNKIKAMKKSKGADAAAAASTPSNTAADAESGSVAAQWVPHKKRPTHRLKFIGKKVDTINWCRTELERLIPKIDELQAKLRAGNGKTVCAAFVEFETQHEAQSAYQGLAHHQPLHMTPRFIGVSPEEVIWKNLRIDWAERVVRNILTLAFVTVLIIFWAVPVAFVGAISNLKSLSQGENGEKPKLPWLNFVNKIPSVVLGAVQGLLPTVLLAVLMALLPIILRLMARWAGKPSLSSIELRVQNSYFVFQVIQVFLITTISSSVASVATKIASHPADALSLLSQSVPTASNFYISYFILQGLGVSSAALLQIVGVILSRVLSKLLDSTPRKLYTRFVSLAGLGWGTVFPIYTLLTVIALTYAIIAPLILGFATIGMYLIYLAYRYNLLFVFNANIDTKGLVYPRALQQTTTGVYLSVVCLIALFVFAKAWGPVALMVIFLVFIALFHMSLNSALDPLLLYLPKSLEVVESDLEQAGHGHGSGSGGGVTATSTNTVGGPNNTGLEKGASVMHDSDNEAGANGKTTTTTTRPAPSPPIAGGAGSKPPNMFTKFFAPHKHDDYLTLRRLVPQDFAEITYDTDTERNAYFHPAITSPTPLVWIPRDELGVSKQEIAHTGKVIPCTDDGAYLNEKGNIVLDVAGGIVAGGAGKTDADSGDVSGKIPIYEEKVYY